MYVTKNVLTEETMAFFQETISAIIWKDEEYQGKLRPK
jgi:hypothetical protein